MSLPLNPDPGAVGQVIQLAVAPVFLLAGVGAILNVMTQRLARVIDRARVVESLLEAGEGEEDARRHRAELWALGRRMSVVNAAITCCTAAALTVCAVVALLFIGELFALSLFAPIAFLFVATMVLLMLGLALLLVEISIAMRTVRVRTELLIGEGETGVMARPRTP
jgi:hypothetical protein